MDPEKEGKYLKIKKILAIVSFILFILVVVVLGVSIYFYWHFYVLYWWIFGGLVIIMILRNILRSRLSCEARLVKFFCPNCKESASRPRHRPNCLKCNVVMYPVRYCPKCQMEDTVVSLTQWKCYQCGSKLREITNMVEAK